MTFVAVYSTIGGNLFSSLSEMVGFFGSLSAVYAVLKKKKNQRGVWNGKMNSN
jgi:hypothetical protein